jgi:hypothetical protein
MEPRGFWGIGDHPEKERITQKERIGSKKIVEIFSNSLQQYTPKTLYQ